METDYITHTEDGIELTEGIREYVNGELLCGKKRHAALIRDLQVGDNYPALLDVTITHMTEPHPKTSLMYITFVRDGVPHKIPAWGDRPLCPYLKKTTYTVGGKTYEF